MTPMQDFISWGRVKRGPHRLLPLANRHLSFPSLTEDVATTLAIGNGRSYGDSGLNVGQGATPMRALDRFIAFDPATGILRCEAGVLLDDILTQVVIHGWFLPVTPGTRFVTVGGAIANDVHGKNHHHAGSFGNHVVQFELLRSDGSRRVCSAHENADWFAATLGGLGLTGIVTWAELQLRRIDGAFLDAETIRFDNLSEFMALSNESDATHEYTVAWIDATATDAALGRGIFSRANHTARQGKPPSSHTRRMPLTPPFSLVNSLSVHAFNALYFHRQPKQAHCDIQHYAPFFYPLDSILEWNHMYGPKGFHQYQCVIPESCGVEPVATMLQEIGQSGCASFLAVLKRFGAASSPGLLSFPQPGLTLALDFPERGPRVHALFERLDAIVTEAQGRLYPAKDSRMPAALFRSGYPQLENFIAFKDPKLCSDFWRRTMESPLEKT